MSHTSHITDPDLIMKLVNSRINDHQQRELELLIPDMDDKDRKELLHLINRANAEPQKKPIFKKLILIVGTLLILAGAILIVITYVI